MLTRIYVGGLMLGGGRMLLKVAGSDPKRWYLPPGKYLEDDETLEMAVSKGFKKDTGCMCAVGDLAYVIESFRDNEERELGIYFLVSSPSIYDPERLGPDLVFAPVEEMVEMDVRPAVLGGKILSDEKRGSHGSATYLVNRWSE